VLATVFLWRETAQEQATRLCRQPGQSILCPACGQDLRGLTGTTCSECGITYTLQQLLHSQPTQADLDEPSGDGSENAA
jgi:predicted amidophosphoribosyltransferase